MPVRKQQIKIHSSAKNITNKLAQHMSIIIISLHYSYVSGNVLNCFNTSQLSVNVPTEMSLIDVLNKYPAMIGAADYSTYLNFKHESYCRSHIERNQFGYEG